MAWGFPMDCLLYTSRVSCQHKGWMTQWGSADLGERGYSPIEILRYFYGDDMYINTAEQISGIPASWPGYDLTIGSSGQKVQPVSYTHLLVRRKLAAMLY